MQYKILHVSLHNQVCSIEGAVFDVHNIDGVNLKVMPAGVSVIHAKLNSDYDLEGNVHQYKFEVFFICKKIRKVHLVLQYQQITKKITINCAKLRRETLFRNLTLACTDFSYARALYMLYKRIGIFKWRVFLYNFNSQKLFNNRAVHLVNSPAFSIVIYLTQFNVELLIRTLDAIKKQNYVNWCVYIIANNKTSLLSDFIQKHAEEYPADKFIVAKDVKQIKAGDFVLLLNSCEVLYPNFLATYAQHINENPDCYLVYSHAVIKLTTGKIQLNIKPGFAIDTLRCYNYIGVPFVLKQKVFTQLLDAEHNLLELGPYHILLSAYDSQQCNQSKAIVLMIDQPLSYTYTDHTHFVPNELDIVALKKHYVRVKLAVDSIEVKSGFYKTNYTMLGNPKISIIIPNKDQLQLLNNCIQSIIEKTTYANFEILIVENNSETREIVDYYEQIQQTHANIQVIIYKGGFNYSAINNYAVNFCSGEYLIFLNNDTEIITPDWVQELLIFAQREDVGVVGAKLLYGDETIQHGGVSIRGGQLTHKYRNFPRDFMLANFLNSCAAVTGACIMLKKHVYNAIGEFDSSYVVAFSDIDLCLQARRHGFVNIYNPYCELYHLESRTRGKNDTKLKKARERQEFELFLNRWYEYMRLNSIMDSTMMSYEKQLFMAYYNDVNKA